MQALKIRRVFAENYKAFAESVAVDVEPLTLIFGANGSGKSALLRLPAAISAGLAGGASPGLPLQIHDNVPLGQSLSSFVHGGAVGGQFSVGVEFSGSAATDDTTRWGLDVSVGKDPRSRNQLPGAMDRSLDAPTR